jgi:glycosyltransferase involved in cell wall biosynthesis
MKILMVSVTFPYPPTRGGTEIRTFYLLKYLHQRHHITLVTQRDTYVTDTEIAELRNFVDELVIFPRPVPNGNFWGIIQKIQRFSRFLINAIPPNVLTRYSEEMQEWITNFVNSGKCDVITCEHSVNEVYIRPHFKNQVKTIVDVHSSLYATCLNQLVTGTAENKFRDSLYLPLLYRYEKGYTSKFSKIVVTTEEDKIQFTKFTKLTKFTNQQDIPVIPNGVNLDDFPMRKDDPGGYRLIFIGAMDYIANIDAVRFFSYEVLPELQKIYPETTFDIVGSRPVQEVLELQNSPGINVTGRVPSMVEYLHQATVCVIPMRTGFGIKNKTLEAMAAGVPVVGSDRGLEGLAVDGINTPLRALRANKPAEYVKAISQLFTQPELRLQISHQARELMETEFTWEIAGYCYEQVLAN